MSEIKQYGSITGSIVPCGSIKGTIAKKVERIEPNIEPLTVAENGEYNAPDGVHGFNPVVINVPGGGCECVSPVIDIVEIDGGHRVSITDIEGVKEFDVMDGKDGTNGTGGGSIMAEDDGNGNVVITMTGFIVSDDGEGNVVLM